MITNLLLEAWPILNLMLHMFSRRVPTRSDTAPLLDFGAAQKLWRVISWGRVNMSVVLMSVTFANNSPPTP